MKKKEENFVKTNPAKSEQLSKKNKRQLFLHVKDLSRVEPGASN